jgi:RimJ/RimL family protein N-acetyltransferase
MIETERLIMRKFVPEDLEELIASRSDEDVIRYLGGIKLQNREAIIKRFAFYLDCYEKFGLGMCKMIWRETGEMIGWSGLQPLHDTSEIEVGYGMQKEFWKRGIGFEAAKGWLKFGFESRKLERIVAVASPENIGSWRIMEKCGMKREKIETFYEMECAFYAISKSEFLNIQNS